VATAVSYHAEMNAALSLGDHSGALLAGWRALSGGVLPRYDEAGVLVNLASLALMAGHPDASLATVRRAIRRCSHPRVRLGAYAKGAAAAAALGQLPLVNRFGAALIGVAAHVNVPFEELEARSELAEALFVVGDRARARRMARTVYDAAQSHRFATVMQRCDRVLKDTQETPARVRLVGAAQRVIAELAAV